jgi:hypothetical protein
MNNNSTQPPRPSSTNSQSSTPAVGGAAPVTSVNGYRLPEVVTLQHAARLSIVEDKPVMFDYWTNSLDKTVLIGVKDDSENKEKLLVKTEEEYTSPIAKIYKVGSEYIIVTENSIYIVDVNIPTKRISNQFT